MDEAELVRWMRSCAIMSLPSLYEGFGMAFLEAMAVGLPVVGTPTGGMADIIESGVNGELVPVRNAPALSEVMVRLLREQEYRRDRERITYDRERKIEEIRKGAG